MATPAQRATAKRLYQELLKSANDFKTHSFRDYFSRRTHDIFQQQVEGSLATRESVEAFLDQGVRDLAMLRRQSVINQMYATGNSVIDQLSAAPDAAVVKK